ncbi:MAG: hypothetical protein BACD_02576 [Bacteroides rodentium]
MDSIIFVKKAYKPYKNRLLFPWYLYKLGIDIIYRKNKIVYY